jgi:hypothetical protein
MQTNLPGRRVMVGTEIIFAEVIDRDEFHPPIVKEISGWVK